MMTSAANKRRMDRLFCIAAVDITIFLDITTIPKLRFLTRNRAKKCFSHSSYLIHIGCVSSFPSTVIHGKLLPPQRSGSPRRV